MELNAHALQLEKIFECRLVKKGNNAIVQVKVKWSSLPLSSATWEDYHVVKRRFPNALAWGQARPQGGDSVTPALSDDD